VALAFASSVGFGLVDFISGLKSRRIPVPVVISITHGTAFVLVTIALVVLAEPLPPPLSMVAAFLGGASLIAGLAAYYRGLSTGAMGVIAPIIGTAAVVPVVFGLILGDHLTSSQALGIPLAVAGVMAIGYRPTSRAGGARVALGAGLGAFAALAIGTYYILVDLAAKDAAVVWVVFGHRVGAVTLIALVLYPYLTRGRLRSAEPTWSRLRRRDVIALVAVGMLSITATSLFATATTLGALSVVAVVTAMFPVTTILLARAFLGERIGAMQRAGAIAALTGVALIVA
jgi:drug/metabolite transporter (DMT)-like permease